MEIKKTNADDIETLIDIRLEMLRVVNNLPEDAEFDKVLVDRTEISLDATEQGRFLYTQLGFTANNNGMVLNLK